LVYWRGWENLQSAGSLVHQFFRIAPLETRVALIEYVGRGLQETVKTRQHIDHPEIWARPRKLWQWRLREASTTSGGRSIAQEIPSFVDWLREVPENVKSLYPLLRMTLNFAVYELRTAYMMDYLVKNAKQYPLRSAQLFLALVKKAEGQNLWLDPTEVHAILDPAVEAGGKARRVAREVANMLGERGDFRFKDVWERSRGRSGDAGLTIDPEMIRP
jgi:hypothetical protein